MQRPLNVPTRENGGDAHTPATKQDKTHVVIIGAGVIGLQCAVTLLEAGHDVTIIAKHHPGDQSIEYTSPWAGAMWRTHALASEKREQRWDMTTFHAWETLVDAEEASSVPAAERSGIVRTPLTNLYTSEHHPDLAPTTDPHSSLWFAKLVPSFESSTPPAVPTGLRRAWSHSSFTVDVPKYLAYLLRRVAALGGVLAPRVDLPAFADTRSLDVLLAHAFAVASESRIDGERGARVFVNTSGLGARGLVGDAAMYPVRGQVLLVRGAAHKASAWHRDPDAAELSYVISRPAAGVSIVGGCKEKNRDDPNEDPRRTAEILESCRFLAPELLTGRDGGFEVLDVQVGLRPARTGGARVERESVGDRWLVHAYGHSGAGYQNSVGVAQDVLGLVEACVRDGRAKTRL